GTPSWVNEKYILNTIEAISEMYDISSLKEFTIELNPESITKDKIKHYLDYGINRFSMGVQSFNDDVLRFLGRAHNSQTAIRAISMILHQSRNLSIDTIWGIPGHLINLDNLSNMPIQHISAYILSIEDGTVLFKQGIREKRGLEEEYRYVLSELKNNGFNRYEVSNFSKPGCQSIHNMLYWDRNNKYIGYGLSASGFDGYKRYINTMQMDLYLKDSLLSDTEILDKKQIAIEDIMLKMRCVKGIEKSIYGIIDKELLELLVEEGLIEFRSGNLKATDRGFLVLNEIILKLSDSYIENLGI
ncbi:radical SAM protein, partial [candidate division WOR-3 bacterium]|nr:radical SAM protein [candidate division WOR-3 bacterium]